MRTRRLWFVVAAAALGAVSFSSGCAYLEDRGNDALDIFELGVTTSEKPQLSIYAGVVNVITIGYAETDGTFYGLARRQVAAMPFRNRTVGYLLWGKEQLAYGDFNAADENSPEPWKVGQIGLVQGTRIPPHEMANCPKLLHLGWVGIQANCHFGELADFLLGWFGADIMSDDAENAPAKGEKM